MTDIDRLRRLYESIHDSTTNGAPSPVVVERADALITALEAEVKRLTIDLTFLSSIHDGCTDALRLYHDRAEQAEADLQTIKALLDEVEQRRRP